MFNPSAVETGSLPLPFPISDLTNNPRVSTSSDGLSERVQNYMPDSDLMDAYSRPDPLSLKRREIYRQKFPGCVYALVHYEGRMVLVPAWHPLNTTSIITHGGDYGSGVFEGLSAEPILDESGKIVGTNVILVKPRLKRMYDRSLPAREFDLPVSHDQFGQAVLDIVAIHGRKIFMGPQGSATRVYIRPSARLNKEAGLGVGTPPNAPADAVIEAFNWPSYVRDPETVYNGSGAIARLSYHQRLLPTTGKHSSGYGRMGPVTRAAKINNAHEALILAAGISDATGALGDSVNIYHDYILKGRDAMKIIPFIANSDGPGEEVGVVNSRLGEFWYPPMEVNRLGGTTLDHVVRHLLPQIGMIGVERTFSLDQMCRKGDEITPVYIGNAIKFAPIGAIEVVDETGRLRDRREFNITPEARALQVLYESEVRERSISTNPQLLTPLPLDEGGEVRAYLDRVVWKHWVSSA